MSEQLAKRKLRLHPEKTRIVDDRETGFDFLGFHHRRVILGRHSRKRAGKESYGVLRWPGGKAQQKFRAQIRLRVGPPGRLHSYWTEVMRELRAYMVGWCQYYRHGQSTKVFGKLDYFVYQRVARNLARAQPTGKKRRPRHWQHYAHRWTEWGKLPSLLALQKGTFAPYRGRAKVLWRAV